VVCLKLVFNDLCSAQLTLSYWNPLSDVNEAWARYVTPC
jgi:hypothetical protein